MYIMKLTHKIILEALNYLETSAMGGECTSLTSALKYCLIPTGQIVIGVNTYLYERKNRFVGHATIKWEGRLYHGDGVIEPENLRSWGMLDPEDETWQEISGLSKKEWSYKCDEAKLYKVTEDDLFGIRCIEDSMVSHFEGLINEFISSNYPDLKITQ
jgi:hypothetical protein